MSSKISSIVKHTVEKNIRNKWFIVLNVLLLLVSTIAINFNTITKILKKNDINFGEKTEFIIYDKSNLVYDELLKKFENDDVIITKEEELKDYTKDDISKEQIVVQVQNYDDIKNLSAKVISQEGVSATYIDDITNTLKEIKNNAIIKENNITDEVLNELSKEPTIDRVMLSVDNTDTDKKYGMQTIFNYLIFFILLMILSKIANDISQEKLSKSIEYVLTSISAKSYLIAKVLSINITFIIQFIFTVIYLLISVFLNSVLNLYILAPTDTISASSSIDLSIISSFIDTNLILYFIVTFVYLIITILILSVIQAVLSSKTTNISEAGNATVLLVTLNLIVYMLSTFFVTPLKAPGALTYILSCIPIVSMYFIPTMILIGQASILQVLIATIVLIISVFLAFKYGAIWFKNGILDYSLKKKKDDKKENVKDNIEQQLVKKEYSKIGYVIGLSVLLFILLQVGLQYILEVLNTPIYNLFNAKISTINISSILRIISFILSLVIPSLFVYSYVEKENRKKDKVNVSKSIKYAIMALPLVTIIQIIVGTLLEKLGLNYDVLDAANILNLNSTLGKVLAFVEIAILPAIFEEMFVRGAILSYTKKYGVKFAIIASSLLFAVVHLNISQAIFAFLMGIILSIVTLKTGNTLASSIIHFLNNGYAILMEIFEENALVLSLVNIVYVLAIIIGVILIILNIIKSKGKISILKGITKEKDKKEESISLKKYRYILYDYTFILACVLCAVLLLATQKILTILS